MKCEIKANEMRMLHIHSPQSAVFSEVYFVLRNKTGAPMTDMVDEARRVIHRYSGATDELQLLRTNSGRRFFAGFLSGAVLCSAVAVVLVFVLR